MDEDCPPAARSRWRGSPTRQPANGCLPVVYTSRWDVVRRAPTRAPTKAALAAQQPTDPVAVPTDRDASVEGLLTVSSCERACDRGRLSDRRAECKVSCCVSTSW